MRGAKKQRCNLWATYYITIPIFAMTANAFTDDRQKAYDARMNEHLTKPLETEAVLKAVSKYCVKNKKKNQS